MSNKITIGEKYNKLIVIEKTDIRKRRSIVYKCKCDCGNITYVTSTNLKYGYIKSCGCYQKEQVSKTNKKHGLSNTKLFYVWQDIKNRCNNPNHHAYKDYGGRGIKICDEWQNDFISFYTWAINNGYKEKLTIDRKNNNGNYEPNNCRWTTMKIQCQNRRFYDKSGTNNPRAKKVSKYTLTGEKIKTYNTIKDACKDNNIKGTGSCISACCKGKQNFAYGYIWKYE